MEHDEKSVSGNDAARPWESYNTVYTTAKAGMEGVDKEKVQRIVYEMSKGSKYFQNEERKEAYMKTKVESMRMQLDKLTSNDILNYQKIADKRIAELEATRDMSRIWLHVDMDAFYAAVETLCEPSLSGKAMAVGSTSMISTANYEARKFGVRAAMPGFIARKLCPQLIFVPPDFKKYTYYSDLTRKVFQNYDPNFLAGSLDEAYLDITEFCNSKGMTGGEVAEELRESVHKETGLTCSAGVAPNRLLAKICSDINKPNGQFLLPNEHMAVVAFISPLPIRKIGGIGKVTENILRGAFGISTCGEMLQKSSFICALFSRSSADFFLSVGLGIGRTDTPEKTHRKSMSNERTFSPTEDEMLLHQKLVELSENLSSDLKKEDLCGRTLTLKLKTSSFEVRTRAVTLPNYICSSEDIMKHAKKLLKAELPASLRLMGLRMSHFNEGKGVAPDPKQKTLSNFIFTDNTSVRGLEDQSCSELSSDNDSLAIGRRFSISSDMHGPCESNDNFDGYHKPDLNLTDSRHGHDAGDWGSGDVQIDGFNNDVEMLTSSLFSSIKICLHCQVNDCMRFYVPNYPVLSSSQVNHDDTISGARNPVQTGKDQSVESNLDEHERLLSCTDDEPGCSSLYPKEPPSWLNGYKCSVCGIELPPAFLEERQEHFDFHLAERLQDEESNCINRIPHPKQRLVLRDQSNHGRQRKKQKASSSQGKHIPIDMFFTKTNQIF